MRQGPLQPHRLAPWLGERCRRSRPAAHGLGLTHRRYLQGSTVHHRLGSAHQSRQRPHHRRVPRALRTLDVPQSHWLLSRLLSSLASFVILPQHRVIVTEIAYLKIDQSKAREFELVVAIAATLFKSSEGCSPMRLERLVRSGGEISVILSMQWN